MISEPTAATHPQTLIEYIASMIGIDSICPRLDPNNEDAIKYLVVRRSFTIITSRQSCSGYNLYLSKTGDWVGSLTDAAHFDNPELHFDSFTEAMAARDAYLAQLALAYM